MANRPDFDPNEPPRELGYEGMEALCKKHSRKRQYGSGFHL
jgi:hypothetical protein